jgi:signal transduction histidine kinase/ActR/RegA family two-component response regulator
MPQLSANSAPPWQFLRPLILALSGFAALSGGLSLAGWFTGIYRLTDWGGTGITIKANTALAVLLCGLGLVCYTLLPKARAVAMSLGVVVALIGGLTLSQYFTGVNLQIDELLAREAPGAKATASPGRMGPPASVSFLLMGVALVCLASGKSRQRFVPGLAITVIAITLLSLTGYLYGAEVMYSAPRLTGISVQTTVMLLTMALAALASVPDRHPLRALLETGTAGMLARHLAPIVILLPLAVGWLRLVGQNLGWYDTAFGAALRTLVEIALLAGLSWWMVVLVRNHEAATRETERRKDEFLALLAHELRNPLAPVTNTLALLERERAGDAILGESLGIMRRQMNHMVRLVDDLLDVSRISRGKLELRTARVDVRSALRQAVEMTRPLAEESGHEFVVDLPGEPLYVNGDSSRLAQAFGNILNNACRYTPRGGRITVHAERQGNELSLSVADNGIGLPADKLEAIFGMFTQVDGSLERNTGGLGLGLHLVRELIEMHGGRATASSAGLGQGSEFRIHLPLAEGALPSEEVPGEPIMDEPKTLAPLHAQPEARARILVVDDNRDSALTLSMLLKRKGNDVATAFDGEAAVEQAAAFQPEIILLDIGLPKLNGYDACRAIRSESRNPSLLIVALTGWGQEEDRRQAEAAGFDAHLTKPVDHGLLASTLARLQAGQARP